MKNTIPLVLIGIFFISVYLFANTHTNTEVEIREPRQLDNLPQTVVRVIDGDTFVLFNGRIVRLVGINTPEYGQYYYQEATERLKQLVEGRNVTLETDITNADDYGRLLRYVYVNDTFVNLVMVREGYAKILIIYPDDKYAKELKEVMLEAREEGLGIWNK